MRLSNTPAVLFALAAYVSSWLLSDLLLNGEGTGTIGTIFGLGFAVLSPLIAGLAAGFAYRSATPPHALLAFSVAAGWVLLSCLRSAAGLDHADAPKSLYFSVARGAFDAVLFGVGCALGVRVRGHRHAAYHGAAADRATAPSVRRLVVFGIETWALRSTVGGGPGS